MAGTAPERSHRFDKIAPDPQLRGAVSIRFVTFDSSVIRIVDLVSLERSEESPDVVKSSPGKPDGRHDGNNDGQADAGDMPIGKPRLI